MSEPGSTTWPPLVAAVAGRPGEELEVYVARGHETEVRAYDGEVESLSSATSAGVGIRVLLAAAGEEGNRLGFAWAGSLEPDVVDATLAEARDNARYATADPDVVLAEPDGVSAGRPRAVGPRRRRHPDRRQGGAGPGPRAPGPPGRPPHPPGRLGRLRRRQRGGGPGLDHRDPGGHPPDLGLPVGVGHRRRGGRHPDRQRLQRGAGARATSTPTGPPPTRSTRAVRMLGAGKAPLGTHDRRLRPPGRLHRCCPSSRGALSGEAVVKGRSFFAGRVGEAVAAPSVTLVDDPTDPRAYGAARFDGEGLACRRNVLVAAGTLRRLPLRHPSRPGGPGRRRPARRCGAGSPARRAPAAGPWCSSPGTLGHAESWRRWATASTCSR